MSKKIENIKKLQEINKRLDGKAKLLYMAYKNGKLNLDNLNIDMKNRILKLEEESKGYSQLKKRLDKQKIDNIKTAIDNMHDSLDIEDDVIDENEDDPNLSESLRDKMKGKDIDEKEIKRMVGNVIDELVQIATEYEGHWKEIEIFDFFHENFEEIKNLLLNGWDTESIYSKYRKDLDKFFEGGNDIIYFDEKVVTKFGDFKLV
jgi:hypothetical protein